MKTPVHSFTFCRPKPWPQILRAVVVVGISIFSCTAGKGQSDEPPAAPTPPPMIDSQSPSVAMTFASGNSLTLRSKNNRFSVVAVNAGETVDVQVRISPAANGIAAAQCLDGGGLSVGADSIALDAAGSGSFQFRAGAKPGLYRVFLGAGSAAAILQFWVMDPSNPNSNPSAVQAH